MRRRTSGNNHQRLSRHLNKIEVIIELRCMFTDQQRKKFECKPAFPLPFPPLLPPKSMASRPLRPPSHLHPRHTHHGPRNKLLIQFIKRNYFELCRQPTKPCLVHKWTQIYLLFGAVLVAPISRKKVE